MSNRPPSYASSLAIVFLVALLAAVPAGCGTNSYRQRMAETLKELEKREAEKPLVTLADFYGYMHDNDALARNWVNLRVPQRFAKMPLTDYAPDAETNLPVHPHRLYPAGVRLPGHERTYEELAELPAKDEEQAKKFPFYLYLAAGRAKAGTLDELAAALQGALRKADLTVPDAWQDVAVEPLDGSEPRTWKKIRCRGPLFFDSFQGGEHLDWAQYEGLIELYIHEDKGHHVIVGWKALPGMAEATLLEQAMPLVAASTRIEPPTGRAVLESEQYTGKPSDPKWAPYTASQPFYVGYREGMKHVVGTDRPVMVFIIKPGVEDCRRQAGNFSFPSVQPLLSKFTCIIVDGGIDPDIELAGAVEFPRTLFQTPEGKYLGMLEGASEPDEFQQYLEEMLAAAEKAREGS